MLSLIAYRYRVILEIKLTSIIGGLGIWGHVGYTACLIGCTLTTPLSRFDTFGHWDFHELCPRSIVLEFERAECIWSVSPQEIKK